MNRDEAISRLKEHGLRRLGVEHLYMFDSAGCGLSQEDLDVDLFFERQRADQSNEFWNASLL